MLPENTEMAVLRRINADGFVEKVRLVKATEEDADGYYVMKSFVRGHHTPIPPEHIPVRLEPTGVIFDLEPPLEFVNKVVDEWNEFYLPGHLEAEK